MNPTLTIPVDGAEPRVVPIKGSISVGRSPDCTLVVDDPEVSGRHCVLWVEHGVPWIRDLDSRNGTFVGDTRVGRAMPLTDGAVIRAGHFVAKVSCATFIPAPRRAFALQDEATGVKYVLGGARFRIGPDEGADLRLPIGESITLLVHDTEVSVGDEELAAGAALEIGDVTLRLVEVSSERAATVDAEDQLYTYLVTVDLNGHTGPEAIVADPAGGLSHTLDATNRAILLYVLAKRWHADQEASVPRSQRGWCNDDDLIIGVWGRAALADGGGKLKALLHRVRAELKDAGFDPWFLEKKRGHTRLRVAGVTV